jgi:hypothetical protein
VMACYADSSIGKKAAAAADEKKSLTTPPPSTSISSNPSVTASLDGDPGILTESVLETSSPLSTV